MKTNELIKIVLFCALLFLVVIEFIIGAQVSMNVNNPEQWRQLMGVLNIVGVLDKVVTVLLLGALAFMRTDNQD